MSKTKIHVLLAEAPHLFASPRCKQKRDYTLDKFAKQKRKSTELEEAKEVFEEFMT